MKTLRPYPRLVITKKGTRWTEGGHPWIYETEVLRTEDAEGRAFPGDPENGSLADVISEGGKYLGTGFVSLQSKIRVRILSRNANDRFDEDFWRRRVRYALDYRRAVMDEEDLTASRVIFGEADGFPGLTVDRFNDLLVTEVLSVGIEQRKALIYRLLLEEFSKDGVTIRGIYERNESKIRTLEGLQMEKGWYRAEEIGMPSSEAEEPLSPFTEIMENGVHYLVDVENGQKTGFFLDQKYNRRAAGALSRGRKVLDCCTHTGSFALNALKGGAASVTAVDVSSSAIEMARKNAALNGWDADQPDSRIRFVCSDVFDYLQGLVEQKAHPYDLIILDPPAFTKSRKTQKKAEMGYRELNALAMRVLPRGGFLATASCSHFLSQEEFLAVLTEAAKDAGVTLKLVERRAQAPDHPILPSVPETEYLKFLILQIV